MVSNSASQLGMKSRAQLCRPLETKELAHPASGQGCVASQHVNQLLSLEHFLGAEQVALNRTTALRVCWSVPVFISRLSKCVFLLGFEMQRRNDPGLLGHWQGALNKAGSACYEGSTLPPCTLSMEGNASQLPHESKATFRSSRRLKGLSNQIRSEESLKPHTRPTQTFRS